MFLTILLSSFLNFSLNKFVVFYQLNVQFHHMSANLVLKAENLKPFSLPNESCFVSRNSLRYRSANPMSCIIETSLGTVDFL